MTNDPSDAHVEKMESVVMDARTDKDKSQMKVELKPNKAETKPRDSNKVVLCGILCLSLCANLGSVAAFFASKETCVTEVALLKEGQEVPLNTIERRRLDADFYHRTVCTREPEPVLKKCAVAPAGTEPCWELADETMEDIPADFLKNNLELTGKLKLGPAVRTIGDYAFYNTYLEGLDLSQAESLVSINASAFGWTDITGTLMIPAKVETIGRSAFIKTKLTSLDLSDAVSLVSIKASAFGETEITGKLVIPAKVETIGNAAFYKTKLTDGDLDLSNAASLESIGDGAFFDTHIASRIEMPFTVPTYNAANSQATLNSFPPGVSIVSTIPGLKKCAVAPMGTAEPCWELANGSMEVIPADFLKENTKLTGTLKLGAAVRTIGTHAFYWTQLEGLDLSQADSLELISAYAFGYTKSFTGTLVIPANVETIGTHAFYGAKLLEGLDLLQAASLVSIGRGAFGFTDIKGTLMIPAKVETIGNYAFHKTNLEGLDLSKAESLVSIGIRAFGYIGITGKLMIPAKVETIGSSAFYWTKLEDLDLSQAESLVSINASAFGYNDITGTLVIPAKVETIGKGAFKKTKLEGLDLSQAESLVSIGNQAFRDTYIKGMIVTPFTVPAYDADTFPDGVSIVSLKKCAFAPKGTAEPCWELADGTMKDIPADFMKEITDLTGTLKLGAAVRSIGYRAFYNTKLEGLDLSQAASLVSIGNRAFAVTLITGTLMIPAKVETIEFGAFYNTTLEGLDLSQAESLVSIGNGAFGDTYITGMIVTPFTVPAYSAADTFPAGVTIVKR